MGGYEDQWERGRSPWELKQREDAASRSYASSHIMREPAEIHTLIRSSRADAAEICGICLNDDIRLEKFSDRCCHRFCHECLQKCESSHHAHCPLCRTSRDAPAE